MPNHDSASIEGRDSTGMGAISPGRVLRHFNFLNSTKNSGTKKIAKNVAAAIAKDIAKLIKDTKLKVQAEIQKDQLQVRAKKIDDLQSIIKILKEKDFDFHIEYINYR